MFSSFQSSPACASVPTASLQASASWGADMDDLAFGCECANPALQIECWGQEAIEAAPAGTAAA